MNILMAADHSCRQSGIALAHPSLSAAADAGIEIVGDIRLFCREAQSTDCGDYQF